jgi:hypothetical protein
MSTYKYDFLEVYVKKGCPACDAIQRSIKNLEEDYRGRVLVRDIKELPPSTNGIGPTMVPVIFQCRDGEDRCRVVQGAMGSEDIMEGFFKMKKQIK